ncbi:hypothetical protein XELAEV_18034167mg [Xenopus laevis]|uniref:Uncharacterized protein n=1 Tax=Xenopus laevis TaxID=8355 RepID=A0A974CEL6_XENLA|nr:hypothetical protein XELAEV_18034167mg [Xenopus laevis]
MYIFNLSKKSLTANEISVLNKGLKFAPGCGPTNGETIANLTQSPDTTIKRFDGSVKSNFSPKDSQGENIKMCHKIVQDEMINALFYFYFTLYGAEKKALHNTMKGNKMIIKERGVIQQREDYVSDALRQMSDKIGKLRN